MDVRSRRIRRRRVERDERDTDRSKTCAFAGRWLLRSGCGLLVARVCRLLQHGVKRALAYFAFQILLGLFYADKRSGNARGDGSTRCDFQKGAEAIAFCCSGWEQLAIGKHASIGNGCAPLDVEVKCKVVGYAAAVGARITAQAVPISVDVYVTSPQKGRRSRAGRSEWEVHAQHGTAFGANSMVVR